MQESLKTEAFPDVALAKLLCAPHQSDIECVHTVQSHGANTCRTSRLNDRDAKACLATNWTLPEPEMNKCVDRQALFRTAKYNM